MPRHRGESPLLPLRRTFRWPLAASYGQLEHIEEAQKEWALFLAAWQANVDRGEDVPSDPVVYALEEELFRRDADRQHWLEGLRKAGVTE